MGGVATLSTKGQVTIPKDIRDFLALEQTDKLIFTVMDDGFLTVKPVKKNFLELGGSVKPKNRPENFSKIRAKVRERIAESLIDASK